MHCKELSTLETTKMNITNLGSPHQPGAKMTQGTARNIIHIHAQDGRHSARKVKEAIQVLKSVRVLPKWVKTAEMAHTYLMGI